ncbi:MLO protein homolog 1-like [Papaver somniferum]|uniref:MLO protein homolog 1-like n=1 Tax=Papaver somniferum TaxID=3469 RepID=UPI000E6F6D0E|nr:MLO protein homolog 1-like [Papaver somniferum]
MAVAVPGERTLAETPTWAVAVVCAVFVIISIIIEHGIHSLGKIFQKRQKKAMIEALEKIKAELMLLGFLSLLLTVGTTYITKICIPISAGSIMLPCRKDADDLGEAKKGDGKGDDDGDHKRKLLGLAEELVWRRSLAPAAGGKDDYCGAKGKVSLISYSGVHQLHIFIFVLAVFHVLYSVITMGLAQAKMKKWKAWELETTSLEYQFTNDPARFRFTHQTSFVKRHSGVSTKPGIRWVVAFFRQFFGSINKVDYLTMRNGFINAHFAPNSRFDFHKYIKRSLEDDFKVVVGISVPLWCFAVIFLLLNVYKWHTLYWISLIPLVILLVVGTKLEMVIMEMALQIQDRSSVVSGSPIVEPNNNLFWFNNPRWILYLIQFTLFQNAFQMAYFLWSWYEFTLKSCFNENLPAILIRVFLGLALQILCSYITFPLYALVTQMGSHMKTAIFEEHTTKALKKWRKAAKDKSKARRAGDDGSRSGYLSGDNTPSIGSSPVHLLHKVKHNSTDIESFMNSSRSYQSDTDLSDYEGPSPVSREQYRGSGRQEHQPNHQTVNGDKQIHSADFSFDKP